MEIGESLEELLALVGARIISKDNNFIHIKGILPPNVRRLAKSISMERGSFYHCYFIRLHDFATEIIDYEYIFEKGSEVDLILELLLATEKIRYEQFCKSIDNEIAKHLSLEE